MSIYTPRAGMGAVHIGGRATGRSLLPPGWPVLALFGLYPLWWVLGISEFSGILFAIPMAIQLVQTPRVRAPRGFGIWALFVVWAAVGILVLQVDAPGAVADTSSGRYVTFLYRYLWYISVSVILLYVGNMREVITLPRLFRAMSYMFVTIVCGGYLGLIAPHFAFPSVLELILPHGISHNGFVQDLIHPTAAQVQTFLGYEEGRPSAPFAYTNDWGLNFACFLPAFVVSWCRRDAGWHRWVGAGILFAAFIPVVYSLNRGLWGALAAMFIFVAVKFAMSGRFLMIGAFVGAVVVLAATVVLSPLGSLVSPAPRQRQQQPGPHQPRHADHQQHGARLTDHRLRQHAQRRGQLQLDRGRLDGQVPALHPAAAGHPGAVLAGDLLHRLRRDLPLPGLLPADVHRPHPAQDAVRRGGAVRPGGAVRHHAGLHRDRARAGGVLHRHRRAVAVRDRDRRAGPRPGPDPDAASDQEPRSGRLRAAI